MKVGIMQPYFVPYLGYWQLMNAVDKYVIYDDVNFIKKGWINRNRILINGESKYFRVPLSHESQNKNINEIEIASDVSFRSTNLRCIELAYKKAPYYSRIFPMIEQIIKCEERQLVPFILNSFQIICEYLDITAELILSSSLNKDNGLKGEKKIISICRLLGATEYYNAIGGKSLYMFDEFEKEGIQLKFLQPDSIVYKQFKNVFQTNLSIIDVMMFNSKEQIKCMLKNYTLVSE